MNKHLVTTTTNVVPNNMTLSSQLVLVTHQTFQTDGSSGMNLIRANTHLGSKSIPESVSKTSRTIPVHTSRIYSLQELFGIDLGFSDYAIGMLGRYQGKGILYQKHHHQQVATFHRYQLSLELLLRLEDQHGW